MGHWYTEDGQSCHFQTKKDGDQRPTTLRDARKMRLFPSVSEVIGVKDKGAFLDRYKRTQILEAAWKVPKRGEYDSWARKICSRSVEHRDNAAQFGTTVHSILEDLIDGHKGEGFDAPAEMMDIAYEAYMFVEREFDLQHMISEKTFTNTSFGYGGTCDLHDSHNKIILDYKTKDKPTVKDAKNYESHQMQLAAYAVGLLGEPKLDRTTPRMYNLFISRTPGDVKLVEATEFDRYWNMFYHLLQVWQLDRNYYPCK